MNAGDLLSQDGCPHCDGSVTSVSSESRHGDGWNQFQCMGGHTWHEYVRDDRGERAVRFEPPSVGDEVRVCIEREVPTPEGWETKRSINEGTVTAVPSRKFDWEQDDFDFDYCLSLPDGREGATRSVDIDTDTVQQLHYDAGGDRDWDTFTLVSWVNLSKSIGIVK